MKQLQPNWTSAQVQFGPAALDCLDRNGNVPGAFMIASISKDGTLGWVARGGALEVFMVSTAQRVAVWSFGAALKDTSTVITAVAEYSYDGAPRLLVGTTSSSTQAGLLCVFDIKTSKVVKAVEVPYKITAIEPVTSVGADQAQTQVLSDHLRCFCGVIAVGTHNGHCYMLDLNLDDETDGSDEVRPNSVLFLDPRVRDVAGRRFSAISKRRHLCLELDDESHQRGYYYLRKPDSSVVKTYLSEELCVSSLLYMKQTASLVVGFNFGCFQLWGLYTPVLEYTSRLVEDLCPITYFTYQEPENDPRNFVYIWVGRGPMPAEPMDDQTASMSLFQLGYGKKAWHEGLGYVYEDLQSVGPRFEHYLTTDPYNSAVDEECAGSRLVCCTTIQDPSYTVPERTENEDSFDDGSSGPDLSLCAFVWEAAPSDPQAHSHYHLAVFDMNRWYHAQMPHALRYSGLSTCSFMAFYSLDGVSEACSPDNILALQVSAASLARYQSPAVPVPEHHLYPSSLAFEAASITESGLVLARFLGQQRQVVADLLKGGPAVLADPGPAYGRCLCAGLLPRGAEGALPVTLPATDKRAAVLNVALDHNQVSFLTACVHAWATGELAGAGCTLRWLLDWAWARVGAIKESMDRLCVPLYDWSGLQLDAAALTLLHHHQVALQHLAVVMTTMLGVGVLSTEQGRADLETKVMVVQLIDAHLSMLIWCYTEGFLPEVGEDEAPSDGRYGFPYGQLKAYFSHRRHEIHRLNSELRGTEVLMIDGVIEQAGVPLQELWEKEGGTGTYPPPSLHAVLNTYLLEGVPLVAKHSIFFYLLCDLMYLTPEETTEKFEQKMHHFAQTFSLPYSTIRLVQGFWHLDRKEFEEAMLFLLDPIIRCELAPWQHTRIVKALLYQGHHKMALKYIRVKKPPMATPEDVKLWLTVLLANGLTAEAFEYQRTCRDQVNMEDLLSHLFLGCQQIKTMDQLLQLPLSSEEEGHLVNHMKTSAEPHAGEVLVLHYLQRARVIEALSLHAKLRHSSMGEIDTVARERSVARQSIVDCYQRILPRAQRKLAFGADTAMKRGASTRREVTRPVPLSTFVNRAKRSQAVSHATLISTVLEKVREVRDYDDEPQPSTSQDHEQLSPANRHPGPFTCTPITPRTRSHISEAAEVIYPSIRQQEASPHPAPGMSPHKKSFGSPFSVAMDSFHPTNLTNRRLSRMTSAAALSLLQTPPVRRKTPSKGQLSAPHSASTPHSILKVRGQSGRADSPLTTKSAAFSERAVEMGLYRKLNMDLTADHLTRSTVKSAQSATLCSSATNTPKQLRFSVPGSPDSTPEFSSTPEWSSTPSPEPTQNDTSPMRRARDRSPTPERSSPKASPKLDIVRARQPIKLAEDGDMIMDTDDDVQVTFQEEQINADDVEMEDEPVEGYAGEGDHIAVDQMTVNARAAIHRHYEEQEDDELEEEEGQGEGVIITASDVPQPTPSVVVHQHYEEMSTASENEEEGWVESTPADEVDEPAKTGITGRKVYYEEQDECVETEKDEHIVHSYYEEQESDVELIEKNAERTDRTLQHTDNDRVTNNSNDIEAQEEEAMDTVVTAKSHSSSLSISKTTTVSSSRSVSITHSLSPQTSNQVVLGTIQTVPVIDESVNHDNNTEPLDVQLDTNNQAVLGTESLNHDEDTEPLDLQLDMGDEGLDGEDETEGRAEQAGPSQQGARRESDASSIASSSNASSSTMTSMSARSETARRPELLKLSAEEPQFKTPPRPTRSTSMPPTPPESGQGTPPQEVSPPKNQPSNVIVDKQVAAPVTPTRGRKSKTVVAPASQKAAGTPLRVTRSRAHTDSESRDEDPVEEPTTPTRSTRASARAATPPRATTPTRTMRATTPPRATTPTRTTRATTPTRTTKEVTPPPATTPTRATRATTPTRTTKESTPPQPTTPTRTTRATTPTRSTKESTPPQATTPTRTTRATTPQRATTPTRVTRGTTPPRATTPTRTTRATAKTVGDSESEQGESVEVAEVITRSTRRRSKATTPALDTLSLPRSTRSSRGRTESTSDAKSTTTSTTLDDDHSDSISLASTSSRRSRGRPSSRSSSPVDSTVSAGNTTPPRTEEQEAAVASRATRSGGRAKTTPTRRTPTRRSTRRQTAEVNQDDVDEALNTHQHNAGDSKDSQATGEGLLSSQSFMMAMRTRRGSTSRDGTSEPGSVMTSDVSSTVTEDDIAERTNFVFSEPMAIDTSRDGLDEVTAAPISAFVFSPPLTRTRSHTSKPKREAALKSKVRIPSILPDAPGELAEIIANNAKKRTAKIKKAKTSVTSAPSDSPINFLSPPVEEDAPEETEPRQRGRPKKTGPLRPKRITAKKKSTLKLW